MRARLAAAPLVAGLLGLAGSLGATLHLHRRATEALEHSLQERLRGAGETAASFLGAVPPSRAELAAVMRANGLEGALLLSPSREILADATGPAGGRADLLRVDAGRAAEAAAGRPSVAFSYAVGDQPVATGYFPVRGPGGEVRAVLALEAGQAFSAGQLLALQADAHRLTQTLDVAGKLVEQGVQSVKQAIQTPV